MDIFRELLNLSFSKSCSGKSCICFTLLSLVDFSALVFPRLIFGRAMSKSDLVFFCANAQDDTILMIVLATHHLTAGIMCYTGARNNNPNPWRHGYLLETGFEVADIVALCIGLYPYALDNIKPDIKVALVFHHLPGILFSGLILKNNLHHNEHLQEIAIWLLVGASFTAANAVVIYNLSLDTQMPLATVAYCANIAFFIYCRF
jgi:hypothetical protein